MKLTMTVLGSLALVVILALSVGALRQQRSTGQLTAALLSARQVEAPNPIDFKRLDTLPLPVARYLRHNEPEKQKDNHHDD